MTLREEVSVLRQEVTSMEDQYDRQLQRSIHEAELSHAEEISREQRYWLLKDSVMSSIHGTKHRSWSKEGMIMLQFLT